jgi:hypothetical protein
MNEAQSMAEYDPQQGGLFAAGKFAFGTAFA